MCILIDKAGKVVLHAFTGKTKPLTKLGILPKDKPRMTAKPKAETNNLVSDFFSWVSLQMAECYEEAFPDSENEPKRTPFRKPDSDDYYGSPIRYRGGSTRNAGRKPKRHVKFLRHTV